MSQPEKRWLVLVNLGTDNAALADLHETLAARGLHVVTAAGKAVLDACAEKSDSTLRLVQGRMRDVARAELARRGAAK